MDTDGKGTRARILKAAETLFYAEGIRAVSMDRLAEAAGVTKKTLYYHFRSKDDLTEAYLLARDQPNLLAFARWYDRAEGAAGDKVAALFTGLARQAGKKSWRGCGFLRTVAELASMPGHPAVKAGAAHKKRFEGWLGEKMTEAGAADSGMLARQLVLLMEGVFSTLLFHRDPAYAEAAGQAARALVSAALAPSGSDQISFGTPPAWVA